MYDMRIFFFILSISIAAFADAFLCLSASGAEEDEMFVTSFFHSLLFTYRMVLGDYDTKVFGGISVIVVWIFFLVCTVFNMIVLFNLLISIIAASFARINSNAENASYKEMAAIISENSYLIPIEAKKEYA
jgi:hypothetical protein